MTLLISIISIFLTIFIVVGFHELGHFIAARMVGVKVVRFSIGFGKALYHWYDKRGTEYVLAPIPLGGYVKLLDETETPVPESDRPFSYNRQPVYKRFLIVIAGPIANLILSLLIYWFLFVVGFTTMIPIIGSITPNSIAAQAGMVPNQEIIRVNQKNTPSWDNVLIQILFKAGDKTTLPIQTQQQTYFLNLTQWQMDDLKPDPLGSLGIVAYEPIAPNIIGKISPSSPAAQSSLKLGDKIIAINHVPTQNWDQVVQQISLNPGKPTEFVVVRQNKQQTLLVNIGYKRNLLFQKKGHLGIGPQFVWPKNLLKRNQYNPLAAIGHAWKETVMYTRLNFIILGKMLTGKISLKSLGGPLTIFESAGASLNHGIIPFLYFLAFLSISIGIINILPIPGLDGGHLLFQVIEIITRNPVSLRIQMLFYRFGMILLFLLIVQTIVNDILRL